MISTKHSCTQYTLNQWHQKCTADMRLTIWKMTRKNTDWILWKLFLIMNVRLLQNRISRLMHDTVKNIPNRYADELIEIMKELGIDRSYIRKADDAFNTFMADYLPVTEEKVLSEIYSYVGRIFEYELKKNKSALQTRFYPNSYEWRIQNVKKMR